MCLAIWKPAGTWVSEQSLFNGFNANHDGAGYAYYDAQRKGVIVKKGYFTFDEFKKNYMADVTIDTPALAHFRISTAGKKDTANCHPFLLSSGAMMHNGPCINYTHCKGDKDRSDTRVFAEDMVQGLSKENIIAILPMIEGFIGTEKIVFLFTDGTHAIANEKQGQWSEGCWFSNGSFRGYFQESGRAYRGDGFNFGNSGGYGGYSGTYGSAHQTNFTKGAKGLPDEITRTIGMKKDLFRCAWSTGLATFVPKNVLIDGMQLTWVEKFCAFLPTTVKNDLSFDKQRVYEATDAAMARKTGPDFKIDADWVVVGECLRSDAGMRVFLSDALPWISPEERAAEEKKIADKKIADEKKAADIKLAAEKKIVDDELAASKKLLEETGKETSTALTVEVSPGTAAAEKAGATVH